MFGWHERPLPYQCIISKKYILCTISLAISYVSHIFVLIFVQYRTISIAMTRTGSQANETTNDAILQICIWGEQELQEGLVSKNHIRCK